MTVTAAARALDLYFYRSLAHPTGHFAMERTLGRCSWQVLWWGAGGEEGGNCYFELHYEIILEDAIAFFIGYWVKNRVPKQSHRTIRHNWTQALDTGRYDNIPCQTKKCTFAITILTKLNMKTTVSLFNTNSELLFNRHIIEQKMKVLI